MHLAYFCTPLEGMYETVRFRTVGRCVQPIILTRQYRCISAIVHSCIHILEVIMTTVANQPSVKVIGANGQISLGKQYAGRQVLVEEQEPGVWLVRTATVIPDTNAGCTNQNAADLQNALSWAQANSPTDTNVDTLLEKLNGQD